MKTSQPKSQAESTHSWSSNSRNETFFPFKQQNAEPFFSPATIQPKLKIGEPDDPYEKQADRVADAVIQMPDATQPVQRQPLEEEEEMLQAQTMEEEEEMLQTQPMEEEEELQMKQEPILQRKCKECEGEDKLQMQPLGDGGEEIVPNLQMKANQEGEASPELSQKVGSTKGGGAQMAREVQEEMSAKIGADFTGVNIHTDSNAIQMNQELGARAFTKGSDIYFNKNEYNPDSSTGKHLLAHELTHVVQQEGKRSSLSTKSKEGQIIQCDPMTDQQRNSKVRNIGLQMALAHSNWNDGGQDAEDVIAAASAAEANVAKTIFSMSMALIVPGFGGVVAGGFTRFGISIASSTATNLGNVIGEGAKGVGNDAIDEAYSDDRPASFFETITSAMQDAMTHTFNHISDNSTNRSVISDQVLRDTYIYWEALADNDKSVWNAWFQEQWRRYENQVLAIGARSPGIVPHGASIDTHENIPVRIRRENGGTRLALVTHTHVNYAWSFTGWLMDAPSEMTTYRFVRWIDDDLADLATSQVSTVPTISEGEISDMP